MKRAWWIWGLIIALAVVFLSPLASSSPDGLERVAEDQGFLQKAKSPYFELIADYVFPNVTNEGLATILAGIVGTLLVFLIVSGVAYLLLRRQRVS